MNRHHILSILSSYCSRLVPLLFHKESRTLCRIGQFWTGFVASAKGASDSIWDFLVLARLKILDKVLLATPCFSASSFADLFSKSLRISILLLASGHRCLTPVCFLHPQTSALRSDHSARHLKWNWLIIYIVSDVYDYFDEFLIGPSHI